MKTLVLYVFHQMNERVRMFFERGFFKDDNTDFLVICNDLDLVFEVPNYVDVIRRQNVGFDFGAWGAGLRQNDRYKNYTHFVFVNSSVVGPFLPPYYTGRWTDIFLGGLTEDIRLFGSTINTIQRPKSLSHVQSFVFAMDCKVLEHLLSKGIFVNCATKDEGVQTEIRMSRAVIQNGWNIGCLLACYRGIDFRDPSKEREYFADIAYPGLYFGQTTHPYEVIFVKANRGQDMNWLSIY